MSDLRTVVEVAESQLALSDRWEMEYTPLSTEHARLLVQVARQVLEPAPIDMILHCPRCHAQHVDYSDEDAHADERESCWTNPPHRSHLCHHCHFVWRPADVPTNGVLQIKTRGQKDSQP